MVPWPVPGRRASGISPRGHRRLCRGTGTSRRGTDRCPRGADGVAEAREADSLVRWMMAEGSEGGRSLHDGFILCRPLLHSLNSSLICSIEAKNKN